MPAPRAIVLLAAVTAVLALPSGASANHLAASVSVTSSALGAPDRVGDRDMKLEWTAACGDPAAELAVTVNRVTLPKNPARKPASRVAVEGDTYPQGPGSVEIPIGAGSRVRVDIRVDCSMVTGDEQVVHEATASTSTAEVSLPPRFNDYSLANNTICGFKPTRRNLRKLQVGQNASVSPKLNFSGLSMLRRPSVKRIKLRIRGGGLDASAKGSTYAGVFSYGLPKPKRAGKAKVWFVLDGTPTNKLTIRILPKRC